LQLFKELQRRNVFRVATGYIISSWLLIQVADLVLENIDAPDWVIQAFMLLLALGFPVAVFFSWAYEVTPDGIKREEDVDRSQSVTNQTASKLNRSIVAVLLIAVAYLFWESRFARDEPAPVSAPTEQAAQVQEASPAATENRAEPGSIAVLPFADLSPGGDQGYFSDGIAEEILNVLVRVEGLSVASRTSAFGFKGKEALGIPAIAQELNVRTVLEGSVRTAGDTIRITAQLIDAQTDKHLWSQTYDYVLTVDNLFQIQDEIARAIVTELSHSLAIDVPLSDSPMVTRATSNLDAYQLYLKARDTYRRRSSKNIPGIIDMLEQAIALDPEYAWAWAGLAATKAIAPSWGVEMDHDLHQAAFDAAQRAIELDDSLALPYAVLGLLQATETPVDFEKAFEHFDRALMLDRKAVNALLWRGIHLLAVGRFAESREDFRRCLEIDPAYANCRRWMALARLFSGDTPGALELFEQGVREAATSQSMMFVFTYFAQGNPSAALLTAAWTQSDYEGGYEVADLVYRSLADPGFDHEREWQKFAIEYEARTGEGLTEENAGNFLLLIFGKFDRLTADLYSMYYWHPHLPDYLSSPERKTYMRELGIYDYWLKAGFPPQCRPVGEDDFECD
jgi:TolB-like protein